MRFIKTYIWSVKKCDSVIIDYVEKKKLFEMWCRVCMVNKSRIEWISNGESLGVVNEKRTYMAPINV